MRIAIAWSYLPALPGLVFQLIDLAVLGGKFQGISPDPSPTHAYLAATGFISLLILLLGFYALGLWYVVYSEAHSFSILRGIASIVVVGLMIGMLAAMAAVLLPLLIFAAFILYAILQSLLAAEQLDGADPASPEPGFRAILALGWPGCSSRGR